MLSTLRAHRGARSVFVVFFTQGLLFATWASRIPSMRDLLHAELGQLGLILLVGSAGSLLSLPLAGGWATRLGPHRLAFFTSALSALALTGATVGAQQGVAAAVAAGLFFASFGMGATDVSMNLAGTWAEHDLGRSAMPWFHGGFSLGTVVGVGAGAAAVALQVPVPVHVGVLALLGAATGWWFLRGFPTLDPAAADPAVLDPAAAAQLPTSRHKLDPAADPASGLTADPQAPGQAQAPGQTVVKGSFRRAWTEPRTLIIGVATLAAALIEGSANDWLALAMRDGFLIPEAAATLVLGVFLVAMTAFRFAGTALVDRFGRVRMLMCTFAAAVLGVLLVALVPSLPMAVAGAALWGAGAALGFPLAMSAAADDPHHAAARVSVASTIGYTAFLMGPAGIGFLADEVGYRHALLVLAPLAVLAMLAARTFKPISPTSPLVPPAGGRSGPLV